jgi:hypothetical protein
MYEGGNPVERAQMLKIDNQKTGVLTEHELSRLMEILEARAIEENAAFSLHPLCRYPFFYTDCKPLPEKRRGLFFSPACGGETAEISGREEITDVIL